METRRAAKLTSTSSGIRPVYTGPRTPYPPPVLLRLYVPASTVITHFSPRT